MESFQLLVDWLADNESAFSAVAAIAVIAGVVYGALRFILQPFLKRRALSKQANPASRQESPEARVEGHGEGSDSGGASIVGSIKHSLAVLLFEPLSENKDDEFLASGISSEVIAHVTQVPSLRVSSRLSSFAYRSGRDDINEVATKLSARFILTGSLRRAGQRIFVIAQLTDTQTQTEIWAQTYDREIEDLFDVQHDIARCITGAVLGEVKLAESLFAGSIPDQQLDAWGLVQKAYHFWLTSFTPEGVLQAIQYLRQAIAIEPQYPSAQAALAMLISQTMTSRVTEDYAASLEEATGLIENAYKQAPNDIDVLENAGVVWLNAGDPQRAELALRRVGQLAPLNLIARGYLALLLGLTGGQSGAEEALGIIAENYVTAPQHPSTPYWKHFEAVADLAKGDNEQAVAHTRECLLGQPAWVHAYYIMANAYCNLGDRQAAEKAVQAALKINPMLTPQRHLENIELITGGGQQAALFTAGLVKEGLVPAVE